jgi:hypothetical protein
MTPDTIAGFILGFISSTGVLFVSASIFSYFHDVKERREKRKRAASANNIRNRREHLKECLDKTCDAMQNFSSSKDLSEGERAMMSKMLDRMMEIRQDVTFIQGWMSCKK